ncbi:MAG: cell division protein FtsQ/DivIB [Bacteroidota bacterium]|jgi:cell division protein FtsQ
MIKINRRILNVVSWVFLSAALLAVVGFAEKSNQEVLCKGLEVVIVDSTNHYFVSPSDIQVLFESKSASVQGKPLSVIDFRMMEKRTMSNPYLESADVYATIDGRIRIEVAQRNPVVRVINHNNEHYYIDDKGGFMPVGDDYATRVPVVSGYIFDRLTQRSLVFAVPMADTASKPILHQVYEVAGFIQKDGFWSSQVEQIYVNQDFEIELVPRVGNHTILLGSSEQLEKKMKNLLMFYQEGASKLGWQAYSQLNLKFANQVVCTRSTTLINDTLSK